jgi:hypothetical protein
LDDPQTVFVREMVKGNTCLYSSTYHEKYGFMSRTSYEGGGSGGAFDFKKSTLFYDKSGMEFLTTEFFFKTKNDSVKSSKIRIKWPNTLMIFWGESYMYESFKSTESFIKSYFVNCPYMSQFIALNYDSYNKIKIIVDEANKSCQQKM